MQQPFRTREEPLGRFIRDNVLKLLFISFGFLCTALGVLGIFLPLLPTVPLLLLAAACFARGSDRCYSWLIEHRHLGPILKGYTDGKGIPLRAKLSSIGLIWLTIPISVIFVITHPWGKILLLLIGLGVTVYLMSLPVREEQEQVDDL